MPAHAMRVPPVEVFVLATKVLLTGVIVFVGEGTGSQIAFALGVATITLYVFAETRPFVDDRCVVCIATARPRLPLTLAFPPLLQQRRRAEHDVADVADADDAVRAGDQVRHRC